MSCNKHDKETEREIMREELKEYQNLILGWARDKNITRAECAPMQRLKAIEEIGELADGIVKNNLDKQVDSVGDAFVVFIILAEQLNIDVDFNYDDPVKEYETIDGYIYELLKTAFQENDLEYFISYLIDICNKLNLNLVECVQYAWNEIKDRKGKTLNNVFYKDE